MIEAARTPWYARRLRHRCWFTAVGLLAAGWALALLGETTQIRLVAVALFVTGAAVVLVGLVRGTDAPK